jgi:hypothetical protein
MKSSTSLHKLLGRVAAHVDSTEQLGVVLIKSILRSALQYKITSEDGKSLVVPILISLRPVRPDPATESTTTDCWSECWKVLGQNVYCRTTCVVVDHPTFGPPASDESLLAQIKPGPQLLNPELVEPVLRAAILTAAASADVGVLASNAVASAVRAQPDLIRDDGSVEITARATVSLPELTNAVKTECRTTCISILRHDILCHEVCHSHVE